MLCAGIDAGSRTMKVVLLDADRLDLLAAEVADQGVDQDGLAGRLLDGLLEARGLGRGDVRAVVATGAGRKLIRSADECVTEITCQARGRAPSCPPSRGRSSTSAARTASSSGWPRTARCSTSP